MKKGKIAKYAGLVGLVGLLNLSQKANAEEKFSFSGSLAGYSPFGEVIGLSGIPYGVELEGDYGNEKVGFKSGLGFFSKTGYERTEFRDSFFGSRNGQVLEGERENSELARFYAGLRLGKPWMYFGIGGVAIEANNLFETRDKKGSRTEIREFHDRKNLHGIYGEFCIGGPLDKRKNLGGFFKASYDQFFDKDKSRGIKFGAGVILTR
ncbi:MAG: hypothetical protein AABX49_02830 [Nanoarchaeota archaeon]